MQGLEIIKHNPKHSDSRGTTHSYISTRKFKELLILKRKKGAVSGNHYHTGKDPTRNPEIQYVISGKIKLTVKNLNTNDTEDHIITDNTELRIAPMIFHRMEMLEDTIFVEFHTKESPYTDVVRMEL